MAESQQMKVKPLKKNMHISCAGCKIARRRCSPDCFLSPYFPGNDPQKFEHVHNIYGAKNVINMLKNVPLNQRAIAAETLYLEAKSRLKDPVHGFFGKIKKLNQKIHDAQGELAKIRAQITLFSGPSTKNIVDNNWPGYATPSSAILSGLSTQNAVDDNWSSYATPGNTVLNGLSTQNVIDDNWPSYASPGLVDVPIAEGLVEVPIAEGLMEIPNCQGFKKRRNYKGVQQTQAGKWTAQVHLGTFKTALDAAMAYDKAALKLHGDSARLNFPNREAVPHADSAQLVSGGENSPSKRRRDSQFAPGLVSTLIPHKDGSNAAPNQTYVPSSVWSNLPKLDTYLEQDCHSSMMNLLFEAINIPIQETSVGMALPEIELPCGSASRSTLLQVSPWPYQNTDSFIEAAEGYVKDKWMKRMCLQRGSPSQTRPLRDGISVHHHGSELVVKVESDS